MFLVSVLFLVSRFIFLSLHQFSEVREEKEKQMSALETISDMNFQQEGERPSRQQNTKTK